MALNELHGIISHKIVLFPVKVSQLQKVKFEGREVNDKSVVC
jgi:hypothetical protein